jgi:hypothetical protein
MAIRAADIPRVVVERIAATHPHPAHFGFAEVCDWPDGALHALMRAGVLIEAGQAESIVCPGCEWQCHKTPTIRRDAAGRRQAYVSCDEEPSLGRIRLPLRSLIQHKATFRMLSECLAVLLGSETARSTASSSAYELGRIKGRYGNRTIGLVVSDAQIEITVGDQRESVLDFLAMASTGLIVDRDFIKRLADRKARTERIERVPDRSRQQARKRKRQIRDAAIYKEAKRLKPAKNDWSAVARSIEGMTLAEGLSAGRIRKIIGERRSAERKKSRADRKNASS